MATLLVLYHPPTDPAAFDTHYADIHIPLAKQLPGLRSYTINAGPVASPAGAAPYYLVAELTFDSLPDLQAALGSSAEGQAATADLAKFAQAGVTVLMYETREA
jgi:uncharacterized protein (TIGR02118 family)